MNIAAGEFKAKCLKLMEDVRRSHEEIVITKFGKPVAKLVPLDDGQGDRLLGFLKDAVVIHGDLVKPTGEAWRADA